MAKTEPDVFTCLDCGHDKPLTNYYVYNGRRVKHCRACHGLRQRRTPSYNTKSRVTVLKRYSLTEEKYNNLLQSQGNACAACGTTKFGKRRPHIDHDHRCCAGPRSCGQCIRGILCHSCNTQLGHLESPRTQMLVAYLESASTLAL